MCRRVSIRLWSKGGKIGSNVRSIAWALLEVPLLPTAAMEASLHAIDTIVSTAVQKMEFYLKFTLILITSPRFMIEWLEERV